MKADFKKIIFGLISTTLVFLLLCSCKSVPESTDNTTVTAVLASGTDNTTEAVTESQTEAPAKSTEAASKANGTEKATESKKAPSTDDEAPAESTTSKYKRTGTMHFSDESDNKYIAAVNKKYGVDASLLAAIYTVPDANGNIVLEFNGKKDSNGKLIRTSETLVAIYSVDKALNCKCAAPDLKKSEYPLNEAEVMFITTVKYIMPKFEKELNG